MNKIFKKIMLTAITAVLAVSTFAFTGCDTALEYQPSAEAAVSNAGFVVEKGNYVYFINGSEEYTAANKMGDVVKASLVRIAKTDLAAGNYGKVDVVVPTLLVAGDHSAGVFIYGDYVYYATPTNVKDITTGEVLNQHLDFKSCKLDGTENMKDSFFFRTESNTVEYRYVEVDGTVYCMYTNVNDIYSYNTETGVTTLIADETSGYMLSSDPESPYVYYTMDVTYRPETLNAYKLPYNQVYMARADVTEETAPEQYKNYKETLAEAEKDKGMEYYHNLGTLVLDGRGSTNDVLPVNYGYEMEGTVPTPSSPGGYKYTLTRYTNDGIYYTRESVNKTDSSADGGWLFYLADAMQQKEGFNPISGNANTAALADAGEYNDVVAYNTTNASDGAIFLYENGKHSYLYTSGNIIYRADVENTASGIETTETRVVASASGATLLWTESAGAYRYLYYSTSGTNGNNLNRVAYNGTKADYSNILGDKNYQALRILDIDYASDWYAPEILEIDGRSYLFFVNAESIGALSYNYVAVMDMTGANGVMTNAELAALNEKYTEVKDLIKKETTDHKELGNAMYYYYMTGETEKFDEAILEAEEAGYDKTYLYSEYYQAQFKAFATLTGDYEGKFTDESGKKYNVQSYFYNTVGVMTEEDAENLDNVWKTGYIERLEETEEAGLATWAWVLIIAGSVLGVAAIVCAIVIPIVLRKKKAEENVQATEEGYKVDMDVAEDIDVYATEETPTEETTEESSEEATEETDEPKE